MSDPKERVEHVSNGINVHYDKEGNVTHLSGEGIEISKIPTNKKESGMAVMEEKKVTVYYLENGKWIDESKLELIHKEHGHGSGYEYYKTAKGNYIKRFYGLTTGNMPKYEICTDKDIERIKSHIKPNPEDEF